MSMSVSFKKATNKTNIKHNNREQKEYDNKEIDVSRMKYNKYLVQDDIRKLYECEFDEPLKKYNSKQKRKDRKIKNYYDHISKGKKTSLQQEIVIQVGKGFHGEDYQFGDDNWNRVNEILGDYFHEFEKRNPNLKVYNAVIHNDETSPHLHINFVPVASGYERGLEKQVAFDKAIKQQNSEFDVSKPFEVWRESEVNEIEKLMNQRGIVRKLVGTNEYEDTKELKEVTEKLEKIEQQIDDKKVVLKEIDHAIGQSLDILSDKNEQIPFLKRETEFEVVKKGFFQREEIEKETGNYILTPKQYEEINKKVNAAETVKKDYERLKNTDLVRENEELREFAIGTLKENDKLKERNLALRKENSNLFYENNDLKEQISHFKHEIKLIYQSMKEFLKGRTNDFRGFLRDFVNIVKEKSPESEFERTHERERRREMNNEMER